MEHLQDIFAVFFNEIILCPLLDVTHQLSFMPISQLRFDYDTTTIRRYHDAIDCYESDRNYDLRSIRLLYDYDRTTTKN